MEWPNLYIESATPLSDNLMVITPHAQRERGKVIGLGVLVIIYKTYYTDQRVI